MLVNYELINLSESAILRQQSEFVLILSYCVQEREKDWVVFLIQLYVIVCKCYISTVSVKSFMNSWPENKIRSHEIKVVHTK